MSPLELTVKWRARPRLSATTTAWKFPGKNNPPLPGSPAGSGARLGDWQQTSKMHTHNNGYGQNRLSINEGMAVSLVNEVPYQIVHYLTNSITAGFRVVQQGGKRNAVPVL